MSDATLSRFSYTRLCTLGRLVVADFACFVVERPLIMDGYPAGKPFASCIPEGEYLVERTATPQHPRTFRLVNEQIGVYRDKRDDRTRYAILIHVGNTAADVVGCLAPGIDYGLSWGSDGVEDLGVRRSREAFDTLWSKTTGKDVWTLQITFDKGAGL